MFKKRGKSSKQNIRKKENEGSDEEVRLSLLSTLLYSTLLYSTLVCECVYECVYECVACMCTLLISFAVISPHLISYFLF
jgi:hypothetical protein